MTVFGFLKKRHEPEAEPEQSSSEAPSWLSEAAARAEQAEAEALARLRASLEPAVMPEKPRSIFNTTPDFNQFPH